MARMSVGVQVKQFVYYLWVLCQKAESFLIIWTVGVNTFPPYPRMGKSKDDARRWHRKGGRPIPEGDSRLIATNLGLCQTLGEVRGSGAGGCNSVSEAP